MTHCSVTQLDQRLGQTPCFMPCKHFEFSCSGDGSLSRLKGCDQADLNKRLKKIEIMKFQLRF